MWGTKRIAARSGRRRVTGAKPVTRCYRPLLLHAACHRVATWFRGVAARTDNGAHAESGGSMRAWRVVPKLAPQRHQLG